MRPVTRGGSPVAGDFADYRSAFPFLQSRLGPYCSYCERRMPTNLAVEHIQPKGRPEYAHLIGRWDNYLLGCVNCNGAKKDRDVVLDRVLLPDRDNTLTAFNYLDDGTVVPSQALPQAVKALAAAMLSLCGLDRAPANLTDENDRIIATDRIAQRRELIAKARAIRDDFPAPRPARVRRLIVGIAAAEGHFSIWIQVFRDDTLLVQDLVRGHAVDGTFVGFRGTALECFPETGLPPSPRTPNGLPLGSKW